MRAVMDETMQDFSTSKAGRVFILLRFPQCDSKNVFSVTLLESYRKGLCSEFWNQGKALESISTTKMPSFRVQSACVFKRQGK